MKKLTQKDIKTFGTEMEQKFLEETHKKLYSGLDVSDILHAVAKGNLTPEVAEEILKKLEIKNISKKRIDNYNSFCRY